MLAIGAAPIANAKTEYQLPPKEIQELMLARPIPNAAFNFDASKAAVLVRDCQFRKLAEIVETDEYKIGGIRIDANNFSESRYATFYNSIYLIDVKSGKERQIEGMPVGGKIREAKWAPDGNSLCFINIAEDEVELYKVDAFTDKPAAVKINQFKVNAIFGDSYTFLPDGRILYKSAPQSRDLFPKAGVPEGPIIQRSKGKKGSYRTFQDLIKNEYDEQVYKYLCTSTLALYDGQTQTTRTIGKPAIYRKYSISPDGKYVLAETEHGKYSYSKKHTSFPSSTIIISIDGENKYVLSSAKTKQQDKADSLDKSKWQWRTDCDATVAWVEKKDSTWSICQCEYPFKINEGKKLLAIADNAFSEIYWGNDDLALFYEKSKKEKKTYVKMFVPSNLAIGARTLISYSTEPDTVGNAPVFGKPYQQSLCGNRKLMVEGQNAALLFVGSKRPDGEGDLMWFIDRFDLKKNTLEQIWIGEAPYTTTVERILSEKGGRVKFIARRESNKIVPQFCIVDSRAVKGAKNKVKIQQVTNFENPVPQLDSIQDRYITYTRADGVKLCGRLYLPAGYDPAKDGRLPLFMWTYPYEFKSKAEAEREYRTPRYTFEMPGRTHHIFWATQGYAVLQGFSMPIIASDVDGEPNDDFVNQLVMNAEAAIHCLDTMGIADTARVAVGGHSYGSFMTANLMCHTKLFKAGLAESGAFNRSLTPYGFQNEERHYWKAQKVYNDMSPFNYADNLSGHVLFVHGTMDENTGTHPIQTERMYYAVAGNGGDADYLQLPYEGHGYIFQENLMQLFYETYQMLEEYVKKK